MRPFLAGAMAGALHAVTGPDHLASLLPLAMGKPFNVSCRIGSRWGLGHGIGVSLMGFLVFALKGTFDVRVLSDYLEVVVGVTLVLIGLIGLRNAWQWDRERRGKGKNAGDSVKDKDGDDGEDGGECGDASRLDPEAAAGTVTLAGDAAVLDLDDSDLDDDSRMVHERGKPPLAQLGTSEAFWERLSDRLSLVSLETLGQGDALVYTGIFHGFSGTGHLLGVLPALTLPSWFMALVYLVAFCIGTTVAMSLFTGGVGDASVRLGEALGHRDLPAMLSGASSLLAVVVGFVWIISALVA